jgi:tetratricopeptide (TPR) repeat protein
VLARKALALCPDCADGYVLLAQAAQSLEAARELLERAVAAGERAVWRRVFVEDAGDFWLIFDTRPYMRARAALAATLWRLGRREEAVEHQRELLRLNPRENQALRYRQANWLLALESYDELEELSPPTPATGMPPGSPTPGRSPRSPVEARAPKRARCSARRASSTRMVPSYLTGRKKLPIRRRAYTVFGEESEAVDYAASAGDLWGSVPGALAWLES